MASSYKCPACGAPIEFKADKQEFVCDYCLSHYTEQQIIDHFAAEDAKTEQKAQQQQAREQRQADEAEREAHGEGEHFNSYHCDNCGATVMTDELTTSTFCYYCHSPVVISERLAGAFKPEQMIPFHITRDEAIQAFMKWAGGKRYIPRDFCRPEHVEKMTGIYLPFWFADADSQFDCLAQSEKSRSWLAGNYRYTETSVYQHERKGSMFLDDTSVSGYSKADQDLLNSIANYNLKEMRDFAKPMLSGFFADQYDINAESSKKPLADQAHRYTLEKLQESYKAAPGSIKMLHEDINISLRELLYTLLPTWMLTYKFKNKIYTFAMNGQNGKVAGELPFDKEKLLLHSALRAAAILALLLLGGYFIW